MLARSARVWYYYVQPHSLSLGAPMQLDETDLAILEIVQREGRCSVEEIARRVGLTKTPTAARLRTLEQRGVIRGYGARVNRVRIGLPHTLFIAVKLRNLTTKARADFMKQACSIREVLECHQVAGESDFLLKAAIPSISHYEETIIDRLSQIKGVASIAATVVLSTIKEDEPVPLDHAEVESARPTVRRRTARLRLA